jgi:hypothetical protein
VTQAIWRNATVQLVKQDARTAIVITPCGYYVRVRASELMATGRKRKPRGADHRKF